jgi:hypothetical protein
MKLDSVAQDSFMEHSYFNAGSDFFFQAAARPLAISQNEKHRDNIRLLQS